MLKTRNSKIYDDKPRRVGFRWIKSVNPHQTQRAKPLRSLNLHQKTGGDCPASKGNTPLLRLFYTHPNQHNHYTPCFSRPSPNSRTCPEADSDRFTVAISLNSFWRISDGSAAFGLLHASLWPRFPPCSIRQREDSTVIDEVEPSGWTQITQTKPPGCSRSGLTYIPGDLMNRRNRYPRPASDYCCRQRLLTLIAGAVYPRQEQWNSRVGDSPEKSSWDHLSVMKESSGRCFKTFRC